LPKRQNIVTSGFSVFGHNVAALVRLLSRAATLSRSVSKLNYLMRPKNTKYQALHASEPVARPDHGIGEIADIK
jgi:hypothetical protein